MAASVQCIYNDKFKLKAFKVLSTVWYHCNVCIQVNLVTTVESYYKEASLVASPKD